MNQGWTCPKCSKVYAPSVQECIECNAVAVRPANPWPTPYQPYTPWRSSYQCVICGKYNCVDTHIASSKTTSQPCLWDGMPETFPGSGIKVGCLSCPCPKCSPQCTTQTNVFTASVYN